jgi:hypothetical protein
VTLTAEVTSSAPQDKPQGAVHFFIDDALLAIVPLATDGSRSAASAETTTLTAGVHRMSARYIGHPQFIPSASPFVMHTVTQR